MKICMFHDREKKISRESFGNKGNNLVKMYQAGIRVPYGFVISCDASLSYRKNRVISDEMKEQIVEAIREMEKRTGKKWGQRDRELILSVRSGAAVSMPGILCTQLNVKMETADADRYASVFRAVERVWDSWDTPLAREYRKRKNISYDMGTGVVVQEMRFGNYNSDSGSGVIFTVNPLTKKKEIYGEYLSEVQGDAIVSGSVDARDIKHLKDENSSVYTQLLVQADLVEMLFGKPQDIEFTYENGQVYILQSRDVRC